MTSLLHALLVLVLVLMVLALLVLVLVLMVHALLVLLTADHPEAGPVAWFASISWQQHDRCGQPSPTLSQQASS